MAGSFRRMAVGHALREAHTECGCLIGYQACLCHGGNRTIWMRITCDGIDMHEGGRSAVFVPGPFSDFPGDHAGWGVAVLGHPREQFERPPPRIGASAAATANPIRRCPVRRWTLTASP